MESKHDVDTHDEVERFRKALRKCRTCKHVSMAHMTVKKKIECIETILTKNTYYICKCSLFVPADNLEYLEWLSEKKERES